MTAAEPTRRRVVSAFAGAAFAGTGLVIAAPPAPPADDADAKLLAACARFHLAHAAFLADEQSQDQADASAAAQRSAIAAVIRLEPRTPEGLRAKARVAYEAVMFDVHTWTGKPWQVQAEPHERLALDVLRAVIAEG